VALEAAKTAEADALEILDAEVRWLASTRRGSCDWEIRRAIGTAGRARTRSGRPGIMKPGGFSTAFLGKIALPADKALD
jgi:hypothetical protein